MLIAKMFEWACNWFFGVYYDYRFNYIIPIVLTIIAIYGCLPLLILQEEFRKVVLQKYFNHVCVSIGIMVMGLIGGIVTSKIITIPMSVILLVSLLLALFWMILFIWYRNRREIIKEFLVYTGVYMQIISFLLAMQGLLSIKEIIVIILIGFIQINYSYKCECVNDSVSTNRSNAINDPALIFPSRKYQLTTLENEIIGCIDNKESKTFCISGRWGEGKTSFINSLLKSISDNVSKNKNYTIESIAIDPKIYDNKQKMLIEFRQQYQEILRRNRLYSGKISNFNIYINSFLSILGEVNIIQKITNYLVSRVQVNSNINGNVLEIRKIKLLIIVDDLDRVIDNVVLEVLSFLKEVLDLEGIIKIIGLSDENLSEYLRSEYLSKYIQHSERLLRLTFDELYDSYINKSYILNIGEMGRKEQKFIIMRVLNRIGELGTVTRRDMENPRKFFYFMDQISFFRSYIRDEIKKNFQIDGFSKIIFESAARIALVKVFSPEDFQHILRLNIQEHKECFSEIDKYIIDFKENGEDSKRAFIPLYIDFQSKIISSNEETIDNYTIEELLKIVPNTMLSLLHYKPVDSVFTKNLKEAILTGKIQENDKRHYLDLIMNQNISCEERTRILKRLMEYFGGRKDNSFFIDLAEIIKGIVFNSETLIIFEKYVCMLKSLLESELIEFRKEALDFTPIKIGIFNNMEKILKGLSEVYKEPYNFMKEYDYDISLKFEENLNKFIVGNFKTFLEDVYNYINSYGKCDSFEELYGLLVRYYELGRELENGFTFTGVKQYGIDYVRILNKEGRYDESLEILVSMMEKVLDRDEAFLLSYRIVEAAVSVVDNKQAEFYFTKEILTNFINFCDNNSIVEQFKMAESKEFLLLFRMKVELFLHKSFSDEELFYE